MANLFLALKQRMTIKEKAVKPKERTETISQWLLGGKINVKDVIEFASKEKDPVMATYIAIVFVAVPG